NAGLAAARAPYIAFHDSDDVVLPGRLAVPLAFLGAHPEVDLVIQNGRMLPPEDDPEGAEAPWIRPRVARALAARPIGVAEVFRWNLGQLQGMCFTRRALDATGPLDPSFTILDDLDLVLRVTLRFRAVFLNVPAFAYMPRRLAGGGTEADLRRMAAGLVARGHEVHTFAARADAPPPGVTLRRVPVVRAGRLVRLLSFAAMAPRLVARERWDVVVGF